LDFQKKQIGFQTNHITEHATVIISKSLTGSAASALFHHGLPEVRQGSASPGIHICAYTNSFIL